MVPMPSHVATIAAAFYLLGTIRKRQRKKPWLERRRLRHSNAMNLLESDELTGFIDRESFDQLLKMVQPFMTKTDSIMSQSISPEERLIATLLFLATGQGYQTIKDSMLICPQLLAKIIPETCSVIYSALSSYIKVKSTVLWLISKGVKA